MFVCSFEFAYCSRSLTAGD